MGAGGKGRVRGRVRVRVRCRVRVRVRVRGSGRRLLDEVGRGATLGGGQVERTAGRDEVAHVRDVHTHLPLAWAHLVAMQRVVDVNAAGRIDRGHQRLPLAQVEPPLQLRGRGAPLRPRGGQACGHVVSPRVGHDLVRAEDGLALSGEIPHGAQVALELPHRRSVRLLPRPHAHEQQLVAQGDSLRHAQPEQPQCRDALVAGECQEVLRRGGPTVRLECRAVALLGEANRGHVRAAAAARQPHHLAARHQRHTGPRLGLRARLGGRRQGCLVLERLRAHPGLLPRGARQEARVDLVAMRRAVESASSLEAQVSAAEVEAVRQGPGQAGLDVAEVARAVQVEDPLDQSARLDAPKQLRGVEVALALGQRVVLAVQGRAAPVTRATHAARRHEHVRPAGEQQPPQLGEGHVHPVRTQEAAVGACEGLQLGQRLEREDLTATSALGRPRPPRSLRAAARRAVP